MDYTYYSFADSALKGLRGGVSLVGAGVAVEADLSVIFPAKLPTSNFSLPVGNLTNRVSICFSIVFHIV